MYMFARVRNLINKHIIRTRIVAYIMHILLYLRIWMH